MTGGVHTNERIFEWITCLAHNFIKPTILSVASTYYTNVTTTPSIAKANSGATFHFLKPEHRKAMNVLKKWTILIVVLLNYSLYST